MHFGEYLIKSGVTTPQQILHALNTQRLSARLVGHIAVEQGLMTVEQVLRVLDRQGTTHLVFGLQAVALGYITEFQLRVLLQMQTLEKPPLGEVLVNEGVLNAKDLNDYLRAYHAANGNTNPDPPAAMPDVQDLPSGTSNVRSKS